jgi:hypothetical protein
MRGILEDDSKISEKRSDFQCVRNCWGGSDLDFSISIGDKVVIPGQGVTEIALPSGKEIIPALWCPIKVPARSPFESAKSLQKADCLFRENLPDSEDTDPSRSHPGFLTLM